MRKNSAKPMILKVVGEGARCVPCQPTNLIMSAIPTNTKHQKVSGIAMSQSKIGSTFSTHGNNTQEAKVHIVKGC